jgi:hypothetical protein
VTPELLEAYEKFAISRFQQIVNLAKTEPGSLPPSVVDHAKASILILKKRRRFRATG